MNIKCFLVEFTGKMTEFENGISKSIFRRVDTGEELIDLPVGAMYYVRPDEQSYYPAGPDGKTLWVVTPGGYWCIDSRASNCTKKDENEHRCWVRHGVPPNITVDKKGNTCAVGAGSIMMGDYHGFLINGELTNC